jgi:ATP-dependent protease ClpP protease subunit
MFKFDIKAKDNPKSAAEIFIYGDIGESWWEETTSASAFVKDLERLQNELITIRINSVGGSVPDGLAIYNAIKRHPSDIRISIDGMAMSIASLIAMAAPCDMAENAVMMIHAPWTIVAGNSEEMRKQADVLDKWAEAMATCYVAKTGMPNEDVLALLRDGEDHYYTADEALAAGLVDTIVAPMSLAASLRVPSEALARFQSGPNTVASFVTPEPAPAATSKGESTMNRVEKIRALFKDYPSMAALMQECIDDENTTPEAAETRLNEALAAATAPEASAPVVPESRDSSPDAVAQGIRIEAERRANIESAFNPFKQEAGDLLATCLNDINVSVEDANKRLLAHLAKEVQPVGTVTVRENPAREEFREGVVAAVLSRAGLADPDTRAKAKASGHHNLTLMEMAKASLSRANVDFSAMGPVQIAKAALTQTSSDFPVLLEEAMHKALLGAYREAPDTWSRFCRVGSVSDFRAHNRYRLGSIGNYSVVNEAGEYENVAIPDGEKSTISAVDRGLIINMTYQMIVNDDLGAFVGMAADLGRAGRRTIEAAVYAALLENSGLGPTMLDGDPLFDANHGNIGTGAAISVDSIEADRVLMASQMDISGNDFLDIRPSVLLCPLAIGGQARVINDAQYDPDTANKLQRPNMVRGLFGDIVDTPRLSGTRRYMFANPSEAPVMEVAFLNGEQEPYIVMEDAFNSRGGRYRATLDFGVGVVDYRGAATNAGA